MKASTSTAHTERVLGVLVHVQEHLDDPLALDDLAAVAQLSSHHFHRVFRALVGESPAEHVRRLRLERAAHRLKFTERPILDVAFEARYDSHEAFTRAFGQAFGMPPSRFRRRNALVPRMESPVDAHYQGDGDARPAARDAGNPLLLERDPSLLEGEVRRCNALRVAFIRHIGPYEEVPLVFGRLVQWAATHGLVGPDMRLMGVAHDDPGVTPAARLRFDTCIGVPVHVSGAGEVGVQEFPQGDYAIGTHFGPFETLSETYAWLGAEFIPQSRRTQARAAAIEIYLSDPQVTRPCDLRTEIRIPLEVQR